MGPTNWVSSARNLNVTVPGQHVILPIRYQSVARRLNPERSFFLTASMKVKTGFVNSFSRVLCQRCSWGSDPTTRRRRRPAVGEGWDWVS